MELFHVTNAQNLPSILREGLLPHVPQDMEGEPSGVYLFTDFATMGDAVMNWLGDRFDEEDELVLLTLSSEGVEVFPTEAGYEVVSYDPIPPENILSTDVI